MSSSSTSSSPMEAVKLSNEATYHMGNGDYSEATVCLSSALVSMREAIRDDSFPIASKISAGCESSIMSSSSSSHQQEESFFFVSRHRGDHDALMMNSPDTTSDIECDDWFLYQDAIIIDAEQAFSSEKSVEILSYSIIYNLALCHHLEAVRELSHGHNTPMDTTTSSSSPIANITPQASLQRAVSLYTQAQKLLVSHELDNAEDMLHTMAITNNLGHAYHFLHNESTAKVCFQRLLHTIMYISDNNEHGRRAVSNHELCFDGFLNNVMNLIGTSSAAPAA